LKYLNSDIKTTKKKKKKERKKTTQKKTHLLQTFKQLLSHDPTPQNLLNEVNLKLTPILSQNKRTVIISFMTIKASLRCYKYNKKHESSH
jgi:hypothetical protein